MLSPDRIKPFLNHTDVDVRALAADYFSDGWSRDPEILPLILDAREKFGDEPYFRNLSRAKHLVITDETLDRLLELLNQAESDRMAGSLGDLIAKAPVELLDNRRDVVANHPKLKSEIIRSIQLRLEYREWSSERLWDKLRDLARESDEFDGEEADWSADPSDELIDELATRDTPDAETLCRLLADPEMEETWLEIYLATLVGRREIREAVPILITKYHKEDADFLIEETTESLARIGDTAAIAPLVAAYPESDWTFKFCTAGTLGDLKHPASEAAILELLKSETDPSVRTFLCVSLCELISEHALETVRKEIASGSVETFRETASLVLSVAAMLDQELPKEAVQWQREKIRQHRAIEHAEAEWEAMEELEDNDLDLDHDDQPAIKPSYEPVRPIRNEGPRAGRNDPCPCGSGKKYKKCCGAR
jgi:HEAT repeat protein